MSQQTAVAVDKTGSKITVAITSGTIVQVGWNPPAPAGAVAPTFAAQVVTIPSLPAGDSTVRVDIAFAPGDGDADVVFPAAGGTVVDKIFRHSQAGTVYMLLLFGT